MPKKEKEELIQQLTDVEQVLQRPGMYIGSVKTSCTQVYIVDENKIIQTELELNQGLLKIFDEVLTNAQDQAIRTRQDRKKTKNIYINICKQTGKIEVINDGPSIEIAIHSKANIYIPQLVFGNLRTSSNYNDDETDRRVAGQNGLGVKLTNIYSKQMNIDIIYNGRRYQQQFKNNMNITDPPQIEKLLSKKDNPDYVKVSFVPDYKRFGMNNGLTEDMYKVIEKRVYDCAGSSCKLINVYLNGEQLDISNFKNYCNLYLPDNTCELCIEQPKQTGDIKIGKIIYTQSQDLKDDTQIMIAQSNNGFQQISFINNAFTSQGGKHVDYIINGIVDKIANSLKSKRGNKDLKIKKDYIKENIILFMNMHVYQPTFNSQSKEYFSSDYTTWGYIPIIEDKFIEKIIKSPIGEAIMQRVNQDNNKQIVKNDGKKKNNVGFIEGLVDASKAGTNDSSKCTLFLVEGKSAAQLVISGRSQIPNGVDYYGVFALRGKVLNVKDASQKQISENNEITQIKKILGLQQGKVYKNASELRYGKILIATDSDTDGFHCSLLCSNVFQSLWPSLLEFEPDTFINRFLTPIIIATKKTATSKNLEQEIDFFTQQDFDIWLQQNESQLNKWKIKYFKGLAVFDQNSGKRHFKNMKVMKYHWQHQDNQFFTLAFDKKKAYERKQWLQNYNKNSILDYNETNTTFTELINKELIHFSIDDVARSICSLMDGFKPSQRKIIYSCFKRKLWNDELRVAQLAGYTSEISSYSHGEVSLQGAIVQMAQDFVGSNNINLLLPNGQFGTRYDPKASGAPRYIHTQLNSITKFIMNQDDNPILNYLKDDEDMLIEPEYYLPILPMALVNGCVGIGTGFSTKIPCYNPLDIIYNLQVLLKQQKSHGKYDKFIDMIPHYPGFKGQIQVVENSQGNIQDNSEDESEIATGAIKKYVSIGKFQTDRKTKINVTEIPIGQSIKQFVENIQQKYKQCEVIIDIRDNDFILKLDFNDQQIVNNLLQKDKNESLNIYKELKLMNTSSIGTTNMYMFNDEGKITKYNSALDVIKAFFTPRLKYYQIRKDYQIQQLDKDLFILSQKAQFIMDIITDKIDLRNKKYQSVVKELLKNNYYPLNDNNQPVNNIINLQKEQSIPTNYSYNFLTEMPISSQTLEKKEQLLKQLEEKKQTLQNIKNKHITDMWNDELELLKQQYKILLKNKNIDI